MIYFITDREHDTTFERATRQDLLDYCIKKDILALDAEFNNLSPYTATLLLVIIGDSDTSFVIDATSVDITFLEPIKDKTFVGHNIKIDFTICKVNGFEFRNVYDTMVAEQRIGLGSGRLNGLAPTLERRFGIGMEKEVRSEFIAMDSKSNFLNRHIEYAAADTVHLLPLMELQKQYIDKFDMNFLMYEIEFPLVVEIGDCELEGFVLDTVGWRKIMEDNKVLKLQLVDEMDAMLSDMADVHIGSSMVRSKYQKNRNRQIIEQGDLFGPPVEVISESKHAFKYTSAKQMKSLFIDFGEAVPMKKDAETVAVPALQGYLLNHPHSILKDFLLLYMRHSTVQKQLSTYGQKFIDMINPITGKIHTTFRTCATDTGRFSSGNVKAGFPNMQNIPADVKFRHCFGTDEGYEITTCDLSGAELIVMVALSGDTRLLELANGDMHSHMANVCWQNIYDDRGMEYTDDLVVSKKQNKDKRTDFKPMTFGSIYGMHDKKAAEQLNVENHEGAIVIATIKAEIPDVFKMVEANSNFAMANGYIIHNKRTNSRRWFQPAIDAKKELRQMQRDYPLDPVPGLPFYLEYKNANASHLMLWKDATSCASAARNTTIQGTQADMVKEAIVEIARDVRKRDLDIKLLLTVHDEMGYRHPKGYQVDGKPVGDYIAKWMCDVSNRYLDGIVEMGADYDTCPTWTK